MIIRILCYFILNYNKIIDETQNLLYCISSILYSFAPLTTRKESVVSTRIVLKRDNHGYNAHPSDSKAHYGFGQSIYQAIGSMVCAHPGVLDVIIDDQTAQPPEDLPLRLVDRAFQSEPTTSSRVHHFAADNN